MVVDYRSTDIFKLAIHEYPDSFQLHYSCAGLLSETKKEQAIDYYRKCIDLYTKNPENHKFSQEYEKALKKIEDKK